MSGYDPEEGTNEEVSIQELDPDGGGLETYYWRDYSNFLGTFYGWYDGSGEKVERDAGVTFKLGDGWWTSATEGFSIQSSGQVNTEGYAVDLIAGNVMTINATPVKIDINQVKVSGYDPEAGTNENVSMQELDPDGGGLETYYWRDYSNFLGTYYGWYDGSGEKVDDEQVFMEPGEGLWTAADEDELYVLEFPGVKIK